MRLAHAICVLLVGASADVAVAAAADTCATGEAAETAIRRVLEDFGSAYIRHDTAALDKIFAEEFASTRPGRDNLITRADYFEAVRTDPNKNISITRADEKIRQYGCTAVVTDRTTRLAEDGPHVYRMTNVLTFRDGRWLMVTRHVSDAARPSPSPAPSSRP
jgi:hypothetical protein